MDTVEQIKKLVAKMEVYADELYNNGKRRQAPELRKQCQELKKLAQQVRVEALAASKTDGAKRGRRTTTKKTAGEIEK